MSSPPAMSFVILIIILIFNSCNLLPLFIPTYLSVIKLFCNQVRCFLGSHILAVNFFLYFLRLTLSFIVLICNQLKYVWASLIWVSVLFRNLYAFSRNYHHWIPFCYRWLSLSSYFLSIDIITIIISDIFDIIIGNLVITNVISIIIIIITVIAIIIVILMIITIIISIIFAVTTIMTVAERGLYRACRKERR